MIVFSLDCFPESIVVRTFQSELKIGIYIVGYRMPKYPEGPGKLKELGAFYTGRAFPRCCAGYVHAIGDLYGVAHGLAMAVRLPHVMKKFGVSAHKRLVELADVCGIGGRNDAEKANAFIRCIEETKKKMGLPEGFDVIKDESIDQMIPWAKKEANPLYPVPSVWGRKDLRRLMEAIRE